MSYKPFYLTDFEKNSGIDTYGPSFLIPENAFTVMENAYAFRKQVKRKEGYIFLGRLRRQLAASAMGNILAGGAGTFTFNIFTGLGLLGTEPNASIESGAVTNITIAIGAPINQTLTDAVGTGTLTIAGAGPITSATLNYSTGVLSLTFSGAAGVSAATFSGAYFPGLPCMGLRSYESSVFINNEQLIAFDTKYAYKFSGGEFTELATGTTWSGTDYNFFWSTNYWQNVTGDLFWVTNFSGTTGDPIRYWDSNAWTNFAPALDSGATTFLQQSLILVPYKDRLVALNTYEGANLAGSTNYAQRIRWSWNGDPTDTTSGWRDDTTGFGGYRDIPTNQQIISVEFIKDVLIIKCESSSWKLIYSGNRDFPFILQQVDTVLGSESTFSLVPFDRTVLSVGNLGITGDDSVNVSRIDNQLPDFVFDIQNINQGPQRVHGIRNFERQFVLWTYTESERSLTYPNKLLVYNYANSTFSIFNDSFTCLGYFQPASDYTWATIPFGTWADWNTPWNSGQSQALFPDVIGGNQQGYVEILSKRVTNGVSLFIQDISSAGVTTIKSTNHNLLDGEFVRLRNILGMTGLNDNIYKITKVDDNNFTLNDSNLPIGTYGGLGEIEVCSNINVVTKPYSPYYSEASQVRLGYIDLFLARSQNGEITINIFADETGTISVNDTSSPANSGLLGSNAVLTRPENLALVPIQANQSKIWHRHYVYAIVQNFQIQFTMSSAQMTNPSIYESDVILYGLIFYMKDNVRLIQ